MAVPGPLEYLPLPELRRQLDVNLVGQLAVIQAFLPLLRQGAGRIVNVSSLTGRISSPFNGAYSAAKHGIEAVSDALRMELRPWNLHVAIIEPGTIATQMPGKLVRDAETVLAELPPEGRERYGGAFRAYVHTLAGLARHGSSPDVVSRAVIHAVTARRPRTRYPVGAHAARLTTMRRFLPDRLLDRNFRRLLGLSDPPPVARGGPSGDDRRPGAAVDGHRAGRG